MLTSTLLIIGLFGCGSQPALDDVAFRADVVVYGGTAAGVVAALQAAAMDKSVVLLEPTAHVGGMTVCGLGATDVGNKAAIGGLSREFYRRVRRWYADPAHWTRQRPDEFTGRGHRANDDAAWTFEPHVAETILDDWLAATPAVVVVREARLARGGDRGVERDGTRIVAVRLADGRRIAGSAFVDATYEGDLLAEARVSYTVGREANAQYGETLNGVQTRNATKHQFTAEPDPYRVPGDPQSGLLPGVHSGGPGVEGSGDARVQAYCYRMCLTDVPENRRAWPKPANYDPLRYELLLRNFEAGDHRVPWHNVRMPNRKTDTNNNFAISTDYLGGADAYPEADDATRAAILADHVDWQQGLMWTLANDPRVPTEVQAEFRKWGLAADEFVDNGGWPYQVYVREGRRMVGAVVMTERHCRGLDVVEDGVGLGSYGMDSHNVQRYVDATGRVRNEGDVQVHGFPPYPISFRAIVPRADECTNLAVPVAVSATHIAFGSIRMEPVFMVLAQSAATALCLALDADCRVQDVDVSKLRQRLLADGQILEWTGRGRVLYGVRKASLPGIVLDDRDAAVVGDWVASTSASPYVESGYLHDDASGKGDKSVSYRARVDARGRYVLRLAYTAHPNRSGAVPVTIVAGEHERRIVVDQRSEPVSSAAAPPWHDLARFELNAGDEVVITIANADTKRFVIADAVQILREDDE